MKTESILTLNHSRLAAKRWLAILCLAAIEPISAVWNDARVARADAWVERMLESKEYDFGTVKHSKNVVQRFPITNRYKHKIKLLGIRSNCSCTSASLEKDSLEPNEVGYIVTKLNTRTHVGQQNATLTLEAAWRDNGIQRTGEAQIQIQGVVQRDVLVEPETIMFGNVPRGQAQEQKLSISSDGKKQWRIQEVQHNSESFEVAFCETCRSSDRVAYDMFVRLTSYAPMGPIREKLLVVTDGEDSSTIPIEVSGRILSELTVSPEHLFFGKVADSQKESKKVVVRGVRPFIITSMESTDKLFHFKFRNAAARKHIVEITLEPSQGAGRFVDEVQITNDSGQTTALTAFGEIIDSK